MKTIKKQSQLIVGSVFGALEGTRTPDLPLRRRLLYPAELQTHSYKRPHILWGQPVERVMGIEPTSPAWKAGILAVEQHPHSLRQELY